VASGDGHSRPVVVVGDADIDLFLRVPRLPEHGEKIRASAVDQQPGGMGANVAAGLAKLSTACTFLGIVGDDAWGAETLEDLRRHGVDVASCTVRPGVSTYRCIVLLEPSGERTIVIAPTPAMFPEPADLDLGALDRARHLHTTAMQPATATAAALRVREHRASVSLDLEADAVAASGSCLPDLLRLADVLFVNDRAVAELGALRANGTLDVALLRTLGPDLIVVTRGAHGSVVLARDERPACVAAYPMQIADTTGAGDSYAAAFLHTWLNGATPLQAARFASAAAALSTSAVGGRAALPTRAQVLRAIDTRSEATTDRP
jgi:ribokinase